MANKAAASVNRPIIINHGSIRMGIRDLDEISFLMPSGFLSLSEWLAY
ncbi:MAG TPA: hypothetical protein VKZ75_01030 [Cyclobacteriaceae bacterium]|nr:hypothetical protein [Cyclobacteriaceae bacterium]